MRDVHLRFRVSAGTPFDVSVNPGILLAMMDPPPMSRRNHTYNRG
jgi:hypothetical protein